MISIITVHYHVKKELFESISSIIASNPKIAYEIIVVDNDEEKSIEKELLKRFPKVKYISNENKGFGQGNNVGAKVAKGEYLFFLNPDTRIFNKTIDLLVNYLKKHTDVGIVAPFLFDDNNRRYLQGAKELTPIAAIFSFSFIHKLFPNNPIAQKYWMTNEWDRNTIHEVASVPGAAFMIRSEIFKKIKGFDEHFFMYFEEHDLCKRVSTLGWNIIMMPDAKVYHALGRSSKQHQSINTIFEQSRFYYFKKHYNVIIALLVDSFLKCNKYTVLLLGILLIGIFLLTYKLAEIMVFIGDQGWFYLSARDMLTTGTIPLVGIPSSHPWLHQGPLWTYFLAIALGMSHFNPISGAYIGVLFGTLSIVLLYRLGTSMFSSRVGVIAALLYATSPLVVLTARVPYHTAPIPFFTLLYMLFLFQWLQGKKNYLPLIIFTLAVLYNLEIATFLLTLTFSFVFGYGMLKKKKWLLASLSPQLIVVSVLAFLLPMIPMLLYDSNHGFPQTVKFLGWNIYKVASLFGYPMIHAMSDSTNYASVMIFMAEYYKRLIYLPANFVAFTLAIFSFGFFYRELFHKIVSKKPHVGIFILGLTTTISLLGIFISKTTSDAYFPILFPSVMLITALFFEKLMILRPKLKVLVIIMLITISAMNAIEIINKNFLVANGKGFTERLAIAKRIVTESNGRRYNLKGTGGGSQFPSYTMNYEYLTWWLGNGPSHTPEPLQFLVSENNRAFTVQKVDRHD
jgi:GT2 family glycosyltransferase/4-amino-4-deoxy-L-arabinose transferase-like glycosyltransferase